MARIMDPDKMGYPKRVPLVERGKNKVPIFR